MCIVKLRQGPAHPPPTTSLPPASHRHCGDPLHCLPAMAFTFPFVSSLPYPLPLCFPWYPPASCPLSQCLPPPPSPDPPPMQHPAPSHFTVTLRAFKSLLSRPLPLSEICTGPSCLCSQKQSLLALSLPSPPHYLKIHRLQVTRHEERQELPVP